MPDGRFEIFNKAEFEFNFLTKISFPFIVEIATSEIFKSD
jgi:hypothetical protein